MGFGFNLFVVFCFPLLLLVSAIIIFYYAVKRKYGSIKRLLKVWGMVFSLLILFIGIIYIIRFFTDKMNVSRSNVYGSYVIDKERYSGKQSNWQYDHYQFEITKKDSFLFYLTNENKIIKTYRGKVQIGEGGKITLKVDSPRNQIIEDMPTLYRNTFSFYYVFHSKYYANVFFKKGRWSDK